jgi:hypothetical protein
LVVATSKDVGLQGAMYGFANTSSRLLLLCSDPAIRLPFFLAHMYGTLVRAAVEA